MIPISLATVINWLLCLLESTHVLMYVCMYLYMCARWQLQCVHRR